MNIRAFNKILGFFNNIAALEDIELFDHFVFRGADVFKSIALYTATKCSFLIKTQAMIIYLIRAYGFNLNGDDNPLGLCNLSGIIDGIYDIGVPLEFAIRYQNFAAIQALFENGADPNAIHPIVGPLNIRAVVQFPAAVDSFLMAGANANIILKEAIETNNVKVIKSCFNYKLNPKAIFKEIEDKKFEVDPEIIALLSDK